MGEFQAPSLEAGVSSVLNQGFQNASLIPLSPVGHGEDSVNLPVKFQWKSEMLLGGGSRMCGEHRVSLSSASAPTPHGREELTQEETQEWLSGSEVHHLLLTSHSNFLQRGCFISRPDFGISQVIMGKSLHISKPQFVYLRYGNICAHAARAQQGFHGTVC